MTNVYDIKNYEPQPKDKYLFDTNVLVFLYNGYNPDLIKDASKSDVYSAFLDKIIKANAQIYVSALNLSEFVNVIVSRAYLVEKKNHPKEQYDKKRHFRKSPSYESVMNFIRPTTKSILKTFSKINDSFIELDTDKLLKELKYDFNDEYFVYLSEYKGFKIVTDDKDFKYLSAPIDIITGNKNLLN